NYLFFFQAEDGIRDFHVTGVQTCALPISMRTVREIYAWLGEALPPHVEARIERTLAASPQHRHGRHRYALEPFGLDEAAVRERFAAYRARFLAPPTCGRLRRAPAGAPPGRTAPWTSRTTASTSSRTSRPSA